MSDPAEPKGTSDRWQRVEALYHEMRARPPDERASALAAACVGDPALAAEVLSLLDQPEPAAGFLAAPAMEVAARLASGASSSLTGRRIGVFEVQGLLGVGGMGEVYRARDTRLGRSVAIKILPRAFKDDPERMVRFEREARVLASLSHPRICALYDVGREGDTDYLVMELVEGETLAARLKKGALPLDQTLRTGIEIADALDKAHRQGVIHRDLKPGNVMLTKSGAKLMDFGLAKLTLAGRDRESISALPTASEPLTGEGTLMGTVPYMAPEQLDGKGPDARSDLWALGCLLYEMTTGRPAFEGKSQASLISAIMTATPPPIGQLQPLTPPTLERLVKVCLAKDPDDRLQTAHDVMQEMKWITETPSGSAALNGLGGTASRNRRPRMVVGAFTLLAGLVIGIFLERRLLAPTTSRPTIVHAILGIEPAEELNSGESNLTGRTRVGSRTVLTWTPDGNSLVFVGKQGGVQRLYVRGLASNEARPIEGTEGASIPAVSPDGRWVAFWANGAIRRAPIEGGPVTELHRPSGRPRGMAWGETGLFFTADGVISSVAAEKSPTPVTKALDAESSHLHPQPLPGGRALIYTVRRREWTWGDEEVVAQVLSTGERKLLLKDATDARYLPSGHLVFLRRGTLFAVGFDLPRLEVLGTPVPVLNAVSQTLTGGNSGLLTGAGQFSVSSTGTLAWLPESVAPYPAANIVTISRKGRVSLLSGQAQTYAPNLALSPDGRQLALTKRDLTGVSLWIFNLERGTHTKLQGDGEIEWPRWTPDGQRVVFGSLNKGIHQLAWQRVDGMGPREMLSDGRGPSSHGPSSMSRDGNQVAFLANADVWIGTIAAGKVSARPLLETPESELSPAFSPDGRCLAYESNASGRWEVYLQAYPGPSPRQQASLEGGMSPAWSRSGRELFFLSLPDPEGNRSMMSISVDPGPTPRLAKPQRLFVFTPQQLGLSCIPNRCYDVAPDGQLFYAIQPVPTPPPTPVTQIHIVTNWVEAMKAKLAAGRVK